MYTMLQLIGYNYKYVIGPARAWAVLLTKNSYRLEYAICQLYI